MTICATLSLSLYLSGRYYLNCARQASTNEVNVGRIVSGGRDYVMDTKVEHRGTNKGSIRHSRGHNVTTGVESLITRMNENERKLMCLFSMTCSLPENI
jgi:hypothetical protein